MKRLYEAVAAMVTRARSANQQIQAAVEAKAAPEDQLTEAIMDKAKAELIRQFERRILFIRGEMALIPQREHTAKNMKWYLLYAELMHLPAVIETVRSLKAEQPNAKYLSLKPGDVTQMGDEYLSTTGKWEPIPVMGIKLQHPNGVNFRRPLQCGCQEAMVGMQHCPIHGEHCSCSMPVSDSISVKNGTCATCGKKVRIYNEPCCESEPPQAGCWYCQKPGSDLFSSEFDTYLHGKCLLEAIKRDRHQETLIIFKEIFLNDGDVLLDVGEKLHGRCFQLHDNLMWYEIESVDLQAMRCLPGEIICRETNVSKSDSCPKKYLKDGGKDADSFKNNPGGQRA